MISYIRCGNIFAVYVEFSTELGMRPFFNLETCNGETIMRFSFGEIIITPRPALLAERRFKPEPTLNEQRNQELPAATARASKD